MSLSSSTLARLFCLLSVIVSVAGCGGSSTKPSAAEGNGLAEAATERKPESSEPNNEGPSANSDTNVKAGGNRKDPAKSNAPNAKKRATADEQWSQLIQSGFQAIEFGATQSDFASGQSRDVDRVEATLDEDGMVVSLVAPDRVEKPQIGAVRFELNPAEAVGIELEFVGAEAKNLAFVNLVATNKQDKRIGRWRWRLPSNKERLAQQNYTCIIEPNATHDYFEAAGESVSLAQMKFLHVQFQVRENTESSVRIRRIAIRPLEVPSTAANAVAATDPSTVMNSIPNPDLEVIPFEPMSISDPIQKTDAISAEVQRIQATLEDNGGRWEDWFNERFVQRLAIKALIDKSESGELDYRRELTFKRYHRISHRPNEQWPGPQIKMLSSLDRQLSERGIDLIVVPIPSTEQVFADRFLDNPPDDAILDVYRGFLLQSLLRQNLEVVDLYEPMRVAFDAGQNPFRPSGGFDLSDDGLQLVADELTKRVARYGFEQDLGEAGIAKVTLAKKRGSTDRDSNETSDSEVVATKVVRLDGSDIPNTDNESPILMISDIIGVGPARFGVTSADVCSHLSLRLGTKIDQWPIGYGIAGLLASLDAEGQKILDGRKVCVLLFNEQRLYRNGPDLEQRWQLNTIGDHAETMSENP